MLISEVSTHAAQPPAAALVGGQAIAASARCHTTGEGQRRTTRAIGMPAILDPSPRVCPESSPTIAGFPQEFGKWDEFC